MYTETPEKAEELRKIVRGFDGLIGFRGKKEGEMNKLIYAELTYRIRSALFEVHKKLGPGFREETYRRALLLELKLKGMEFETEKEIPIIYQGNPIDIYRMDLVVADMVILELKAVDELHPRHEAQLLSYLRASGLPVGLLVNFGEESLRIIRRVNQKSVKSVEDQRNPRTDFRS
ncbi:MAG: GxxExxY protein [Anaerolineales bacterium]